MYRIVRRFRTAALITLATLIVLAAVLVSVFRVLAPQVPEYRAQIEQVASEAVGQPVTVGDIDARWQGLGPEVRLLDVRLGEADGEQLELGEVRVRFGLPHLIRQQALRPDRISVLRSRLFVLQDETGQWHLRGLDPATMDAGEAAPGQRPWEAIVPLLEDFGRLALRDSTIVMRSPLTGDALLEFTDINLLLDSTGTRHQLEAEVGLPGIFGRSLELELDATGPLAQPGRWNGDLYINGRGLRPGDFFAEYLGEGIEPGESRADIELWSHWQGGDPQRITLDYKAEQIGLPARRGYPAAMLDEFSGRVVWRQLRNGWRVDASRLGLSLDGRAWPGDSLSVEVTRGPEGRVSSLSGLLDYLDLEDVHRLLVALPDGVLEDRLLTGLDTHRPEGEIRRLDLAMTLPDDEPPQINLDVQLVGLGWQGQQMIPGVTGVDGTLRVRDNSASLDLDSSQLALDYSAVFGTDWLPARVRGQLGLHRAGNGWVLEGQQIDFVHPHGRAEGRFAVELPEDGAPYLDISGEFGGLQVAETGAYLPRNVMPETVVTWLEQALLDGEVASGRIVLQGRADEFPFDEAGQDGLFRVAGEVNGVRLDFDPEWPDVLELDGELLFEGAGMRISGRSGTLQGAKLSSVMAEIPDLSEGELSIQGVAEAHGDALAGVLRNSPLGGAPGHVAQGLSGGGPAELGLSLAIPLTRAQDTRVDGVLRWHDATLAHDFWPASLDQINGELHFSNERLYARGIQARMLGDPVTLDINHQLRDGVDGHINVIEARGTASARALSILARAPEPSPLSGQTQWNARIEVPPGDSDESLTWRLTSSLHGLAVDMPEPLAKPVDDRRVVRVFGEVCCEGQRNMDIRYGDVASARLRFESGPGTPAYLRRGLIAIGAEYQGLPESDGVHIRARMPELDTRDIQAWMPDAQTPVEPAMTLPEALPAWLSSLDVALDTLHWADNTLEQVNLRMQREDDGAAGVQVSTALFSGQAQLPADLRQGLWRVDLDRVNLLPRDDQIDGQRGWLDDVDPRLLPPIDLNVADVQFGEWPLGRLEAQLRPRNDGVRVEESTMASDDLRVRVEGDWRRDQNGADHSDFRIHMRSGAPDVTAKRLGYEPLLEARRAVLDLDLAWPGNPAAIDLAEARGDARLRVRDGALLNVEPGAGRFFGLVSVYALPRRLSLDFGDVIGSGMAFDSIDGNFDIGDGQAYTRDLEIVGPAAEVRVSGRTGLVDRDLDQRVEVTPSVSSGVALAGTVAGGPVVGAALFVMQEMLQRPLGRITRTRYHIHGSWDDPSVEQVEEGLAAAPVRPVDEADQAGQEAQ